MYDAPGQYVPPSRAFSRHHSSGRWQTRTLVDFPSAARGNVGNAGPAPGPSDHTDRKFDIEALLAEVTELASQLEQPQTGPAVIRQFPQRRPDST